MIKKIPIPMAGLILSLFAIGNLLATYSPKVRLFFGIVGGLLYIMYVARILLGIGNLFEELKNPVIAGVFATFPMSTMLFATYIKEYIPSFAYILWIAGVLIHAMLIVWFTLNIALKKDIKTVFTTWFIMYVGIAVASVSGGVFEAKMIAQYCFWFAFVSYLALIPIVSYRLFVVKEIPEPAMATSVVFTAPGGLLLAGYMSAFETKNMIIVIFLLALSSIFYIYSLSQLIKIFRLKFYPSLSAITFPTVITAIGFKMTNIFLSKSINFTGLLLVVKFMEIISLVCVLYCLVKYLQFMTKKA